MNRMIPLALVFLSFGASSCEKIKLAHEKLVASSFKLNKHFILTLDDEKKFEESENLIYKNGVLKHSNVKTVFIAKDYQADTSGDEIFLNSSFTCENVTINNDVVLIKQQKDDVTFATKFKYDQAHNALQPINTTMNGEVGVLFLNWSINAVTSFKNFEKL